ncbi:unnamed protein product [Symbiodinium sp. CCMP2592]|nr:unnamed protein product [Symbiodinium sp. CCMP2592]
MHLPSEIPSQEHHALQGVRALLRKADRPRRRCHPLTRPSRENSSERALLWTRSWPTNALRAGLSGKGKHSATTWATSAMVVGSL